MEQNNAPLVSVKMITYNHAPYIAKAIEGVLMQETDFPFELVIGEDCSTDGTREIVFDYQKRFPDIIRVVTSEANVGMHANGRRVEAACRGRYIAFCEGDDYWIHPKKLARQVSLLESEPGMVLVHSAVCCRNVTTERETIHRNMLAAAGKAADVYSALLAGRYHVYSPSACVRRSVLDKIRAENPIFSNPSLPGGSAIRWLFLSKAGSFGYIDEPLAVYNILPSSASHFTAAEKAVDFALSALRMKVSVVSVLGASDDTKRALLEHYARRIVSSVARARGCSVLGAIKESEAELGVSLAGRYRLLLWCAERPCFRQIPVVLGIPRAIRARATQRLSGRSSLAG